MFCVYSMTGDVRFKRELITTTRKKCKLAESGAAPLADIIGRCLLILLLFEFGARRPSPAIDIRLVKISCLSKVCPRSKHSFIDVR
jgi:hypothetical protein